MWLFLVVKLSSCDVMKCSIDQVMLMEFCAEMKKLIGNTSMIWLSSSKGVDFIWNYCYFYEIALQVCEDEPLSIILKVQAQMKIVFLVPVLKLGSHKG